MRERPRRSAAEVEANSREDGRFDLLVAELATGLIVAEGGDLDGGIERALGRVVEFHGADRSTLFRLVEDDGAAPPETGDTPPVELRATDCATRPGIPRLEGVLVSTHFPVAFTRILGGESVILDPGRGLPEDAPVDRATCRAWGIESSIAAPLVADGRVVGAMAIGQLARRREWSEIERSQLATVAGLFASAVARRRAHAELSTARTKLEQAETRFRYAAAAALGAQEDERRRIARDLHDVVVQRLVSLSLELELAGVSEEIAEEARGLAEAVHGHSRRLHPRLVESLGLRGALEAEVANFEERFSGSAILIVPDLDALDGPVPGTIATVAYRVVQEALRNILRHADATTVQVRLEVAAGTLRVEVEDDGRGCRGGPPPEGLGLVSMRERTTLAGGRFEFGGGDRGGVRVRATLPLDPTRDVDFEGGS